MNVRDALNPAIDEEMSADPKVFLMGEEVRNWDWELFEEMSAVWFAITFSSIFPSSGNFLLGKSKYVEQ